MVPPVNTKRDFVERYKLGEFGNASLTWDTIGSWERSMPKDWNDFRNVPALYHLRNRVAGGPTYYNLSSVQLLDKWDHLTRREGIDPKSLYISEMAPHHKGTLQGEIMESPDGLYLHYNLVKKPMREGMAEAPRHAYGLEATGLLKTYMDANSYDWSMELLRKYTNHVVEFSCFSTKWGTLPNFNTVIWEVRNY